MENIIIVSLIGLLAGMLGTGTGGLLAMVYNHPTNRFFSFILGFSGGLMLAIVCFDLLPEAFFLAGEKIVIIGIVLGVILVTIVDEKITIRNSNKPLQSNYLKTGILLGMTIAVHNFPEGLAIGSGMAANMYLGIGLAVIIALHNIPEGIAMSAPLIISGISKWRIVFYAIAAGVPMGIGAYLGAILGNISSSFIGISLGFAGGAMLFITCQEIIPKANFIWKGRTSGFAIILGIICGIMLSRLI